jgi:hypothetical protein
MWPGWGFFVSDTSRVIKLYSRDLIKWEVNYGIGMSVFKPQKQKNINVNYGF